MEVILEYWPVIGTLASLLGAVCMAAALFWLQKRFVRREAHEALKQEVKAVDSRVDDLGKDFAALAGKLENLPTNESITKVLDSLSEVRGDYKSLNARLDGLDKLVARVDLSLHGVETFLLEYTKK